LNIAQVEQEADSLATQSPAAQTGVVQPPAEPPPMATPPAEPPAGGPGSQ
jgi:hypothetical protein